MNLKVNGKIICQATVEWHEPILKFIHHHQQLVDVIGNRVIKKISHVPGVEVNIVC